MSPRVALFVALLAALVAPLPARAQIPSGQCSSCESCTAALATAGATVELGADVDASSATTCVRIAGRGATFDGRRHTLRGAAVGVEVAADDVVVRNVQVQEGGVGIRVTHARGATLFADVVNDARAGIRVEAAANLRVVRASLSRNRVGVSMGADEAGRCAAQSGILSPGVVVVRSEITGGSVGVAACDAMPVLLANTVSGNDQGVVLGDVRPQGTGPLGGPWDDCSCTPPPAGYAPGSLMLYSSGCGGCQVHESWLAEERGRGAVIQARPSGAEGSPPQARFDAYLRHCGPEVMGALGIPGCVPNYACPATGEVWKRRRGERELAVDRSVNSPAEVVAFSEACRSAARTGYGRGPRCVTAALRSNTLCGNRQADLSAPGGLARWGTADDHCGSLQQPDGGTARCAHTCDGVEMPVASAPSPEPAAPPAPAPRREMPSIEETPVDAGAAPPVASAPAQPAAPGAGGNALLWVVAAALAVGIVAVWRFGSRKPGA